MQLQPYYNSIFDHDFDATHDDHKFTDNTGTRVIVYYCAFDYHDRTGNHNDRVYTFIYYGSDGSRYQHFSRDGRVCKERYISIWMEELIYAGVHVTGAV